MVHQELHAEVNTSPEETAKQEVNEFAIGVRERNRIVFDITVNIGAARESYRVFRNKPASHRIVKSGAHVVKRADLRPSRKSEQAHCSRGGGRTKRFVKFSS